MKYIYACLLLIAIVLSSAQAQDAQANQSMSDYKARNIVSMLSSGGYTVYIRHTHTDRSRGDTDFTDCNKQRLLSDQGRDEARAIGEAYEKLQFPIGRLISTELCRIKETTELAFSAKEYEIINKRDLYDELATLLGTPPAYGTNTFIVAHIGTIEYAMGIKTGGSVPFDEGDTIIFRPTAGGGYAIAEFVDLLDWEKLVEAKLSLDSE